MTDEKLKKFTELMDRYEHNCKTPDESLNNVLALMIIGDLNMFEKYLDKCKNIHHTTRYTYDILKGNLSFDILKILVKHNSNFDAYGYSLNITTLRELLPYNHDLFHILLKKNKIIAITDMYKLDKKELLFKLLREKSVGTDVITTMVNKYNMSELIIFYRVMNKKVSLKIKNSQFVFDVIDKIVNEFDGHARFCNTINKFWDILDAKVINEVTTIAGKKYGVKNDSFNRKSDQYRICNLFREDE